MRFKDKIVLVTGAATNTGFGIAQRFAEEGAVVVVNGRPDDGVAEAAAKIHGATGARVIPAPADLADPAAIAELFAVVQRECGRLDVLVNNAAQQALGYSFVDTPLALLDLAVRVNLLGTFQCSQYAARMMIAQGGGGAIINVSSNSAERALRRRSAYVASKGAVDALTRAMAIELGQHGIRVNAVAPGYIHTVRWNDLTPSQVARRRANVPLGQEATAEDVAEAILFLASNRACNIAGTRLVVDGGCSIQMGPADTEV